VLRGEFVQRFFGHREHAAGAAGAVIKQVGARIDLIGDGNEEQLRHKFDGIARRPVFASLFVVCLVEAADKLLENRAHGVVVEAGILHRAVAVQHRLRAEIDRRIEEFLDQGAEHIGLGELRDLIAELEVVEDFLHVRRKAVEVGFEVGLQLRLARAVAEIAQCEA
jgi:hypothetical protein